MSILNLNMLHLNKKTIPITVNADNIESIKPFLIDHTRGIEGTQIRTSSGDQFSVTETYQEMNKMLHGAQETLIVEEVPATSVPVLNEIITKVPADVIFEKSGAAAGIADPAAIDK